MTSPSPYFFPSRWPYVVDGLIAIHVAAGLKTFDGPEWATTADMHPLFGVVGYSGDPPGSEDSGSFAQALDVRSPMRSPDEDGTIRCALAAYTGDVASKTVRDSVFGALALISAAIRTDPTLGYGGRAPFVQASIGKDSALKQWLNKGSIFWLEYSVDYTVRLG